MAPMTAPEGYPASLAYRLAGVTYRVGTHLARLGVLRPSMGSAETGTIRLYSHRDLVALRVARELRGAGLSLPRIRRCVRVLATDWIEESASAWLVTSRRSTVVVTDDAAVLGALLGAPGWRIVVDVGHCAARLRRILETTEIVFPRRGRPRRSVA